MEKFPKQAQARTPRINYVRRSIDAVDFKCQTNRSFCPRYTNRSFGPCPSIKSDCPSPKGLKMLE